VILRKRTVWIALTGFLVVIAIGIGISVAFFSTPTEYCLLLFGPEAESRVWVEVHGRAVFLHRNKLGASAESVSYVDRQFAQIRNVEIFGTDGETRYVITGLSVEPAGNQSRRHLMIDVDVKGPAEFQQYCDVELRADPTDSAVAHFGGPLTAGPRTINWKLSDGLKLVTGDKPTDLFMNIGTMDADRGCWVVVRTHQGDKPVFPDNVHPMVEVEFPSKSSGGEPVVRQYPIDKFC